MIELTTEQNERLTLLQGLAGEIMHAQSKAQHDGTWNLTDFYLYQVLAGCNESGHTSPSLGQVILVLRFIFQEFQEDPVLRLAESKAGLEALETLAKAFFEDIGFDPITDLADKHAMARVNLMAFVVWLKENSNQQNNHAITKLASLFEIQSGMSMAYSYVTDLLTWALPHYNPDPAGQTVTLSGNSLTEF